MMADETREPLEATHDDDYKALAKSMSENLERGIFPRYSELALLRLLHLSNQIVKAKEEAFAEDEGHLNWTALSSTRDPQTGLTKMQSIGTLLQEYYDLFNGLKDMIAHDRPYDCDLQALKELLEDMKPMLTGNEFKLYDTSVRDLATLRARKLNGPLARWIGRTALREYHFSVAGRFKDDPAGYNEALVQRFAFIVQNVVASIGLVVTMVILYQVQGTAHRLITIGMFHVLFVLICSCLVDASTPMLGTINAATTIAAVEGIFLVNNMGGNGTVPGH